MKEKTHQTEHPQVQRLNEILELKKLTKADIARICGVSAQSVNNWFVRGTIGKSSAIKLADALGVSLEWVLGQEVDEKGGLKPDELRLLELYRQLPEEEQKNMLRVFSIRLKELDELYDKYIKGRIRT
ncbi:MULTISPECIES: helix-turn-helix domain-containing protein [Enterobacteriaceae]|jgi:transcriptional regulator with XRE-family HTH domain|uniref:helix-turn-helix domain-containing protein n=1 Tax=Enterobacteriaceae TaxID=543 RepID=UPI000668485F|nr:MULTISPECIES: helix-turn-helix domain-containing protein [Enterobacteriaceae]HAV1906505.1 helix-turn-helix domain-containing protein [Enterobacter hormaechei subsp. steigerwaltii]HDH1370379.1 helix-turn-helix domain-containing protein [Klebsiella quasipneumoniae subsp. similipneumoniae]HDR2842699.1 helix-turn-helix domain-containing protein [Enterobacter sichuanensis]HDS4574400.1 helix-turn-helix domain-containing protein [Klebsiella pneumoniae subsp. pneumoniae]AUU93885.1 transcriptional r